MGVLTLQAALALESQRMLKIRVALLLAGLFLLYLAPGCNNYDLLDKLENPGSGNFTCGSDCRIFVTSNIFSASMGGVHGADNLCRFDPANPDGTGRGNWKAMLVSSNPLRRACDTVNCQVGGASENFDWPLRPNTPYRRPDGIPIGTTSDKGIFEAELTNSIGTSDVSVWTGLNLEWQTNTTLTCADWTDDITTGLEASAGLDTAVTNSAISLATVFCTEGHRLYCVEQ
ncbi:MAG: hypothetical protein OHK0011_16410 [Turneriella sp.]